ncbi:MAG: polymerase [Francisellaceae bacterium]|nr:polymerase [Francisellaceae bacterium]
MSDTLKKPFILVDGSSYLFRAFHALPPLTNSKGVPTGAMLGVLNMLKKLLNEYEPDLIGIIFDSKGKNFRHEFYEPYKANRLKMPEELGVQIEPLFKIIKALGLPLIVVPGVEADDIIGSYALQAKAAGLKVLISTNDKDLAQLVDEDITLLNPMNNEKMDSKAVKLKFGVNPDQIVDYLSLVGDSVDNIPGVPSVGPKTAAKWLQEYHTLENIIQNKDKISGKVGDNLRSSLDILKISKFLASLRLDITLEQAINALTRKEPDRETLRALFEEFEFKSWLKDLGTEQSFLSQTAALPLLNEKTNYECILSEEQFNTWLNALNDAPLFAIDTETTSLDYMQAKMVGISFAIEPFKAAYLPFGHDYENAPIQLTKDWVLKKLKPLLENANKPKIGHNLKYDIEVFANEGIHFKGGQFDTLLESYVLNSGLKHNLENLATHYLNTQTTSFEAVAGKGAKQITFNKVELEKAVPYASEDADITLRLHQILWPEIEGQTKLSQLFKTIEMPLMSVLAKIERFGVLIDGEKLTLQSAELAQKLSLLEEQAFKIAGCQFNLNSPKQLQEILYTQMKLPIIEKTPTGQPSTAENVLQELANLYELPQVILEYRTIAKLKSTYTDKLPLQINPNTGRIHTSYHQAVTNTGRLSSSDPNLQNIPIRQEEGRKIRSAFIALPGYKILSADYSQIELRLMAHFAQDKTLLKMFLENSDVHRLTASEIFGLAPEAVSDEDRRNAKAINFGLIYGMSSFGLSKQLNIPRKDAEAYIESYFKRFPGIKNFMDTIGHSALEKGYVETLYGRRIHFPELKSNNNFKKKAAMRGAINAPLQGSQADIIKLAMVRTDQYLSSTHSRINMIMQVHDELIFEVPEEEVENFSLKIKELMTQGIHLSLPLIVDVGVGDNWDEAH